MDTTVPGVVTTTGSNKVTEGMVKATGGKVVGTETGEAGATTMVGTTIGDTTVAVVTPVAQTETATVPSLDQENQETGPVETGEGTTITIGTGKSAAKTIATTIVTKGEEFLRAVIWTGDALAEVSLL